MQDYWERREEMWDDYFAAGDAIRERYASEIQDMRDYEESEGEYYEYLSKVYEAGFGDDWQAYEAHFQQLDKDIQQFSASDV